MDGMALLVPLAVSLAALSYAFALVLPRQEIDFGSRPLESVRFGGAIDNIGGDMLAWLTRTVDF